MNNKTVHLVGFSSRMIWYSVQTGTLDSSAYQSANRHSRNS